MGSNRFALDRKQSLGVCVIVVHVRAADDETIQLFARMHQGQVNRSEDKADRAAEAKNL
jgi:hypothetical protein